MTIPRFEVSREFDGRAASHWMDKWTGALLRRSGDWSSVAATETLATELSVN
jgi:hypothetical protein